MIVIGADSKRLMKQHNQPQYHGCRFPQGPKGYEDGRGFRGWSHYVVDYSSRLLNRESYIPCKECPFDGCNTIIIGNDWKTLMKFHIDSNHGIRFEETNLGRLPPEILIMILQYMVIEDQNCFQQRYILRLGLVCKKLNEITKWPELYREVRLIEYTDTACPTPFFKKFIKSSGSQLRNILLHGKNTKLLTHTLKNCGNTLQHVIVEDKTLAGIATMLGQIMNLTPAALKDLEFFQDSAHLNRLSFRVAQVKSDAPLFSRISGLMTDFDYKVFKFNGIKAVKLISQALCGMQGLQWVKVTIWKTINETGSFSAEFIRKFQNILRNQDSLLHFQISFKKVKKVEEHDQVGWNFSIMLKRHNCELPSSNPSEAFKMFLQGLREIKKVNQEV